MKDYKITLTRDELYMVVEALYSKARSTKELADDRELADKPIGRLRELSLEREALASKLHKRYSP